MYSSAGAVLTIPNSSRFSPLPPSDAISAELLRIRRSLLNIGLKIDCLTNFEKLHDVYRPTTGSAGLTGVFDYRHSDIGPSNGFWILATNTANDILHIQAVRHDFLSQIDLVQHWQQNSQIFYPAGYKIDFDLSDFHVAPAAYEMTGSICYLGDYWLDESLRNMKIAPLLSEYGKLEALLRFSPRTLYAFMQEKMVKRGWAARAGFLHFHPWAPRWNIKGTTSFYDEYFVWISGEELERLWGARQRNIDVPGRKNVTQDGKPAVLEPVPC